VSDAAAGADATRGVAQPIIAGLVVALVGFASSFAIVLAGLHAVGASDAQASSGLLVLSVAMGITGVALSYIYKMPLSMAWTTPGAALLIAAGHVSGGYAAAVGAFAFAGVLIVLAGLWAPLTRLLTLIPGPLASGLLAGVLLQVCVAPAQAVAEVPKLAGPMVLVWLVLWKVARRWAVPGALAAAAIAVALDPVDFDHAGGAHLLPQLTWTTPAFDLGTLLGLGLPLFVVTTVSQNVAGMAVLAAHGYRAPMRPVLVTTGAATVVGAPLGGHGINLAAITAAMAAGPDAGPDPGRRWLAAASAGALYFVIGPCAGLATALLTASPPVLIEGVAGLALLSTLGAALRAATDDDERRDAAIVTFAVTASGVTALGISAPFWGLVAGLGLLAVQNARYGRQRHEPDPEPAATQT
jgi:benzoate membrane transport protein